MKRLLLASAMGLAAAGCAPGDVQRNVQMQFRSDSNLEVFRRSPELDLTQSGGADVSEFQGRSERASGVSGTGASAAPDTIALAERGSGEAESPSGPGNSGDTGGPSSEPDTSTEAATTSDDSVGPPAESEGGAEEGGAEVAAPTTPGGSRVTPKKDNPSCENSGGRAATCG
jgi:hypothetical protein